MINKPKLIILTLLKHNLIEVYNQKLLKFPVIIKIKDNKLVFHIQIIILKPINKSLNKPYYNFPIILMLNILKPFFLKTNTDSSASSLLKNFPYI